MKKMTMIAFLIGMFATSQAFASDAAGAKAETDEDAFATLDADQDGFVSMEEAKKLKGLAGKFAAADSNGDGKLVLGEFSGATAH